MERRFLVFHAGKVGYALPLREVAEVLEAPPVFPLPRVPDHVLGAINVHGALTAVVDLARFTGTGRARPDGKALVIDARLAALALWVDDVGSILPGQAILEGRPGEAPLTDAVLVTEGGALHQLSLESLVESLEAGLPE